jgi:beta-glucosidase
MRLFFLKAVVLMASLGTHVPSLFAEGEIYRDPKASVEARVEDLLGRLTTEEKIRMIGGDGFTLQENKRLGIPAFLTSDASMGIREHEKATAYANGIALAATWDTALAEKIGASIGRDARARGIHILLGPGMNLYRSPLCGRNFEYLGEDPFLAGTMASQFIRGVQSQGVAATAKHFVANEQELDRNHLSSNLDERTLRELYMKPFEIAVTNGVLSVMTSYNPVNGIHASQHDWLLNQVLKKEWKFRGMVMSDWGSCYDPLAMANGGLDLEMPRGKMYDSNNLVPLIESGKISQATIDDKVRRQLFVAFTLGWFDRPQKDASIPLDDAASAALALQGARESVTLLKNDKGVLPLDPGKTKKVVLLGHNADPAVIGGGGSAIVEPFHAVSVRDGIRSLLPPEAKVTLIPWKRPAGKKGTHPEALDAYGAEGTPPIPPDSLEEVKTADAVVVCVGFRQTPDFKYHDANPSQFDQEGEGGNRPYLLPPGQQEMIRAAAKLNPRTIVILNAGGSVATADWIGEVGTFLDAYYPGQEGGTAIAEILFGRTNPSGKLPFSWERRWEDCAAFGNYPEYGGPRNNTYKEGVFLGYRWFDAKGIAPLFPFGFGLSYTLFSYSDLKMTKTGGLGADATYMATVVVRNTGMRAGSEVVQLYVMPPQGDVPRPVQELKGFSRMELTPQESKPVSITFKARDLAYWDPTSRQWIVTPGNYTISAGPSSDNLPLQTTLSLP